MPIRQIVYKKWHLNIGRFPALLTGCRGYSQYCAVRVDAYETAGEANRLGIVGLRIDRVVAVHAAAASWRLHDRVGPAGQARLRVVLQLLRLLALACVRDVHCIAELMPAGGNAPDYKLVVFRGSVRAVNGLGLDGPIRLGVCRAPSIGREEVCLKV